MSSRVRGVLRRCDDTSPVSYPLPFGGGDPHPLIGALGFWLKGADAIALPGLGLLIATPLLVAGLAVAYDAQTGRASVRPGRLEVPEADDGRLRLSSVVIVKRVEKVAAGQKAASPFQVGDLLLSPNLGEAAHKEASKQLPFFFTLYAPKGSRAAPKASVELRQNGKTLARPPAEMNEPDAQERYQYLTALPLENITPGETG